MDSMTMPEAVHRWLINARSDRSYVIASKEVEAFLIEHGYCRYMEKARPFMTLTHKGRAYARRAKSGRA